MSKFMLKGILTRAKSLNLLPNNGIHSISNEKIQK